MRRGFTLVEALLSLGLIFVLLGIVAQLVGLYSQIVRKADKKQSSLYSAKVALDDISRQLSQAVKVDSPTTGATSSTLSLTRMDPWNPYRLPDPAASPQPAPPASWRPHKSEFRMQVLYSLDTSDPESAKLVRTVSYSDGSSEEEVVCEGLSGLQFRREANATTVTVTVDSGTATTPRILPLTVEVFGPWPPRLVGP